ncbi:hypothetical protein [Lentzea sp. HUAS12]|uniref:hypothetical protein n=1 Tax=Lentzea sp. HUAS12 TaxID=2951806 RepID=UPI00209DB6BB|nr:hypothetical protein [Lentzea sp. HUAS12]USX49717.1 hypothetical protein ND450_30450 [Lentzea sp. HUAS12]
MSDGLSVRIALFGVCVVIVVALVVWFVWRKKKREEQARITELTAFADSVGGSVQDRRAGARPWSAEFTRAMASEYGTFFRWLGRQSEGRFDYALDFSRGRWRVRISEASLENATSSSTRTAQETRVEVATTDLVTLKIIRRRHAGSHSQERGWAAEVPVTVSAERDPLWMEIRLPASVDHAFVAFTSDLPEAARVLNHGFLALLLDEVQLRTLTFEAGIVHTTLDGPIFPRLALETTDLMVALLERVPGLEPRDPKTAA